MCSDKHYSRLPAGRGLGRDPPVSDLPEAQREHRGWAGGFCSPACMEDFQLRSNQGYMHARVLETEQGVCQHCGLNAHQLSGTPRTHTARKYWTTPGWHNSLSNRLGSFLGASSAYFAILASFFLSILSIYLMLKYYMLKLLKHFNVHFLGVLFLLKCNAQYYSFSIFTLIKAVTALSRLLDAKTWTLHSTFFIIPLCRLYN